MMHVRDRAPGPAIEHLRITRNVETNLKSEV
jgi:hypothetical protein